MKFQFVEEKEGYAARIKVVGVGGAGGNAINNMIAAKLRGVEFFTANTDIQALERSTCSHKIQLGVSVTKGLGAGADPEIGRQAAEENTNEIKEAIKGADMVFITAGMGGGTGTGACPVVARQAKEDGSLTVAVVTKPFKFEGDKRMRRALEGIDKLKKEVDTLIIIPNERLKAVGTKSSTFRELIVRADEVLLNAVKGISDLIMSSGFINLDFADVKKVMEQMGTAIMGTGKAKGETRATEAAKQAINSPLLEDISVHGARGLLMNITGPSDMTMEEIDEASNFIKGEVDGEAEIFWGVVFDDNMGDEVQITVIATGIDKEPEKKEKEKIVKLRDVTPDDAKDPWTVRGVNGENLDVPTFQRVGPGGSSTTLHREKEEPQP
ncbi:MAG TPA: cell division protein FtsZ, partial [Desulfatiglandales bacterium]|nr:cell division protein FtsZ [Desulfatiglandales bacterium]